MIAPEAGLSVTRQCALLAVARSSFYHRPRPDRAEELEQNDEWQLQHRYMQVEVMAELAAAAATDPRQIPCAA